MSNKQKQKQKYQMKPLMYIVQPDNQDINVNMQSFVVKKAKPKSKPRVDGVDAKVKSLEKEAIPQENKILEIPEEIKSTVQENQVQEKPVQEKPVQEKPVQEKPVEQEQSAKQYRKQRKPITQMSIVEKIEFFTNLPKNMPRTLCQIETTEEKYRGVIISEVNGIVTIRSLAHAKPIELPLESIQAINLLGF